MTALRIALMSVGVIAHPKNQPELASVGLSVSGHCSRDTARLPMV